MEYQGEYDNFNILLQSFLQHNTAFTVKGEVQSISTQLSRIAKQPYFLDIAIRFMLTGSGEKEKLIFVTSLIKDKFKFDFQLVQRQKLLYYYNKICEIGHLLGCKYYAVYTNLALALTYLYIHISARSDEQLETFLKPFIPSDPNNYQYFNYYFKILQCLAMQVDNSKIVIDQEYREAARSKLLQQQYDILLKLNENTPVAWEIKDIDNENILQCFVEWVNVTYNPQVLNSLPNHSAMNRLFLYVQDNRHTHQTAECLKELVHHLRDPNDAPLFFEYMAKKMVELISIVDYFLEQGEVDEADDYLRIVIQFSRKAINILVNNFDDNTYSFLRRLATFTEENIVPVYQKIIQFWEQFLSQVIGQAKRRELHPQILDLVGHIYTGVCEQCHYPLKIFMQLDSRPEHKLFEHSNTADEIFNRRETSEKIFELLSHFYGQSAYLLMIYRKIEEVSTKSDQYLWPYLEVYLFSLVQALREVPANTPQVQNIVNIYIELSRKENFTIPIIIRKTFLRIFKSLMTIKQKEPTFIKTLFSLTATSFPIELTMPFAEKTFERGCEENYELMQSNVQEIIALIQQYPHKDYIVRGIIHLICHNEEMTLKYMPSIFAYLFQKLKESAPNRLRFKEMMYSITGTIKVLQEQAQTNLVCINVTTNFIRSAFPYILQELRTPKNMQEDADEEIERMVKLLKHVMRYLQFSFTQFIQPLYGCVLECFPRYPINSYAYLVEIAITVFYSNPQYSEYFRMVFVKFCSILYVHLSQADSFQKYSFLFDDFLGVSKRFFVYNASILLNSGELPNIIHLCTNAFTASDTPRVSKGAYSFFETIFMVYWRQEFIDKHNSKKDGQIFSRKSEDESLYHQLKTLLLQKLQFIVGRMMEHLSEGPYQAIRHHILKVLTSQIKAFPQENVVLWPKLLAALPPDILVNNQKIRFSNTLQLMLSHDFSVVKGALKLLKKYIYLINKRMLNSKNRKFKL